MHESTSNARGRKHTQHVVVVVWLYAGSSMKSSIAFLLLSVVLLVGGEVSYYEDVRALLVGNTEQFVKTIAIGTSPIDTQPVPIRELLSNPIDGSQSSTCSRNVGRAVESLERVTLGPGEKWSYVAAVQRTDYEVCGLYTGGYLCNLAARYAQVADGLGLAITFVDHNIGDIGAGPNYSVAIFYDEDTGLPIGGQDLTIVNTTPFRVTFTVAGPPDMLQVRGVLWN